MNKSFELGFDYGLRNSADTTLGTKHFLIREDLKYDYLSAISDLNGFDTKVHNIETAKIFDCLYSWLS